MQFSGLTLTSVTVSWVVPYTPAWQQYSVIYGVDPDNLDWTWGILYSLPDVSATNQMFSITIVGLTQGTDYYVRVSSTFTYNVIYSELTTFTTLEPREHTWKYNIY